MLTKAEAIARNVTKSSQFARAIARPPCLSARRPRLPQAEAEAGLGDSPQDGGESEGEDGSPILKAIAADGGVFDFFDEIFHRSFSFLL